MFHTTVRRLSLNVMNINARLKSTTTAEEIRIPVPWGHIAGKWWGPQNQRPILSLHGWQDNCGTFDRLMPLMPKHLSFLTIDLPGHGLSSRLPDGLFYHTMNGSIMLRQLQIYFNWDKISLMGHSLGAIISFTFGFMYPKEVDFIICIDGLHPLIGMKGIDGMVENIEKFIKYDDLNRSGVEPPSYTLEDMQVMFHKATRQSVDMDKCSYLFERNIKESKLHPGKYYFNRDPRLKCSTLTTFTEEQLIEGMRRATFPLFLSKAEFTPFFRGHKYFETVLNELKAANSKLHYYDVPGQHHAHLNTPEIFKDIIPDFINQYDTVDRSKYQLPEEIRMDALKLVHNKL